jgi:hypothetical protein
MLLVMLVATAYHLHAGDPFGAWAHPLKAGVVFLALLVAGGGDYALGYAIRPLRTCWCR